MNKDCPKCGIGRINPISVQVHQRTDGTGELQALHLDQCGACEGVWFDAGEMETYLSKGLQAVNSKGWAGVPPAQADAKPMNCLRCAKPMHKVMNGLFSGVRMDACDCGCVWLDSGEIDALERGSVGFLQKIASFLERWKKTDPWNPGGLR